jgi:hypothetical protein
MQRAIRLAFLAVPATLALGACGGTTHIGEITPVVSHRIDGTWVYNAKESDDPAKFVPKMQEGRGRRTGGEGGEGRGEEPPEGGRVPPGGGGGVYPGGGMGGWGGYPGGGGMRQPRRTGGRANPAAMREVRRLYTTIPTRIDIALTDSLVTMTYAGQEPFVLPFGKKVERALGDSLKLEARSEWNDHRLVVERDVSGGGGVTETFMPSVDGTRLTVDVDVSGGPGGGFEFQRVFNHPEPKAGAGASG